MDWVILIGLGVLVTGALLKVGLDLRGYVRADREANRGRLTVTAARRAMLVVGLVVFLIVALIVWPLVLGDG